MQKSAATLGNTASVHPSGRHTADPYGWRAEAKDLMRAITGGAIVGMPLLYTMEMWWHGKSLSAWQLLTILGAILFVNFVFSLLSGFRQCYSVGEALSESVTAVGIGLLFSAAILALIGELNPSLSFQEMLGKILVASTAVSVGVSFANSQVLGKSRVGEAEEENDQGQDDNPASPRNGNGMSRLDRQLRADLSDAGATLAGATVFAMNIAPTEEVMLISSRLGAWQLLLLLAATMGICYIILFASGFEQHQVHVRSVFQHPLAETILTCAISLVVSLALLALFGRREALGHASTLLAATVTLGLPAVVGGAAGRLIV